MYSATTKTIVNSQLGRIVEKVTNETMLVEQRSRHC